MSDNVISAGVLVRGRVRGRGTLLVEGGVEGPIELDGDVHVATTGMVDGAINGHAIHVAGRVGGAVRGDGLVTLDASAKVKGDVTAERIDVHPGAQIEGRFVMPVDLPREVRGGKTGRRW